MKKLKILFEVPEKWVDYESPLFGFGSILGQRLDRALRDQVVQKLTDQMILPEIRISSKEIKDRMLTILAERALDKD